MQQQPDNQATSQLNDLVTQAKGIVSDIDTANSDSSAQMDAINTRVDESSAKLDRIYSGLDRIDKESADQLDKLILQQAQDLSE